MTASEGQTVWYRAPDGTRYKHWEVIEDEALKPLVDAGEPVTFRVWEDEWTDNWTVRTIKRAEIVNGDTA